ncbi:MAG: hypothetical protein ACOY3Y_20695 [Acidobacteriota bacterium]
MFGSLLLAAAATLPLGAWPEASGPFAALVEDVEFYLVEPEDDFHVLAVQPLQPPIAAKDMQAVTRLARLAVRLGADAVVLLGEMPEASIPDDVETPLPTTGRYSVAVFVVFDDSGDSSGERPVPTVSGRSAPGRAPAALVAPASEPAVARRWRAAALSDLTRPANGEPRAENVSWLSAASD